LNKIILRVSTLEKHAIICSVFPADAIKFKKQREKKDNKEMKSIKVEQITFPELRVASLRQVGQYGVKTGEAFAKIAGWACKNKVFNAGTLMAGAYYDCPKSTPPEKCRMDACVTLSPEQNPPLEDGIVIQTLPGGLCATYLCSVYNNDFCSAWNEMGEWMSSHKAAFDSRPCYEIYYGPTACTSPLKKWVIDVVMPLKERISE
jgi:AraC family transcriptional regulator